MAGILSEEDVRRLVLNQIGGGIKVKQEHRIVGEGKDHHADLFLPDSNTAIELKGDKHASPHLLMKGMAQCIFYEKECNNVLLMAPIEPWEGFINTLNERTDIIYVELEHNTKFDGTASLSFNPLNKEEAFMEILRDSRRITEEMMDIDVGIPERLD